MKQHIWNHKERRRPARNSVSLLARAVLPILPIVVLSAVASLPLLAGQLPAAALQGETSAKTEPQVLTDPLGRTTPYDTVINFIRATGERNFARAAEFLNSRQSLASREELSRTLIGVMCPRSADKGRPSKLTKLN